MATTRPRCRWTSSSRSRTDRTASSFWSRRSRRRRPAKARPRPRSASPTRSIKSARRRCCACASLRSAPASASRAARPAAATPRWCRWRTSTCISPATCTPSASAQQSARLRLIDNHIYWGNALGIDARRITWRRAIDMNDRALRSIVCFARRRRQRLPARGRLRHHRRVGDDGDFLPCHGPCRSEAAAGEHRRRIHARAQAGTRGRPQGARADGRVAQGRAVAQSGADARRHARFHSWRAVRQHRAWLQFGAGDDNRAEARRLCGH